MPSLIATGEAAQNHWEKGIPRRPVTLGRLASESEWVVDWDGEISRKHATLEWRENKLLVRKEPNARNPISYKDQQADEFTVGVGEQFFIGRTKFELREDTLTKVANPSTPITKAWFEAADLQQVKFSDAETRIEILAALPGVIRTAPSEEELQSRVLDVLLNGVTRAESVAVVRVDLGEDGGEPKIEILCDRSRSEGVEALMPSRSLVTDATQRFRRSILHLWQPGSLHPGDPADQSFDWAICSPLPDEPSPGMALYLSGRFETTPWSLLSDDQEEKLKPDIKFTGLVAEIFGALLQVLNLQRREAQLSLLLSSQIREALVGRDMEAVLSPRETDVTVLFCDLRGSSRVAGDHQSELMIAWEHVSSFLGIMTASISDQGGVIGDFQGDAAMGFWGWPKGDGGHAGRAARAALIIRKRFLLEAQKKDRTLAGFQCGMGIASGRAIAGRLGVYEQAKVGVYGPRVNLASRLESMTKLPSASPFCSTMSPRSRSGPRSGASPGAAPPSRQGQALRDGLRPHGLRTATARKRARRPVGTEPQGLRGGPRSLHGRQLDVLPGSALPPAPRRAERVPLEVHGSEPRLSSRGLERGDRDGSQVIELPASSRVTRPRRMSESAGTLNTHPAPEAVHGRYPLLL